MEKQTYYQLLQPQISCIKESESPYIAVTERHLQIIWFEQKYFKSLTTSEGLPVTVISPGIWNAEAGPDFKKAHLRIGEKEVKGDVEVHLTDSGWYHHKHHTDKRYENVVFHLSLWNPKKKQDLVTSYNTKICQAYLEKSLTISLNRIMKLIDVDLYPYYKHTGTGKCGELLFRKISDRNALFFFRSAAEWRLQKKTEKMRAHSCTSKEALLLGISSALGFKNNSTAFSELYKILSTCSKMSEKELFALSLGLTGFFAEKYQKQWEESSYYDELRKIYHLNNPFPERRIALQLLQIRPFNHPVRRLSYLVKILCDPVKSTLYEDMLTCWKENWQEGTGSKELRNFRCKFENLIPSYDDLYWNKYYFFSSKPSMIHLPLVGKHFYRNILVNCFFPLIYEDILRRNHFDEIDTFWKLFADLRSTSSGKSKYLTKRFFGNSRKGDLFKRTLIEQGAYQLHSDFCIQFEASCDGCPFVKRYKQYY